ncbi:DUF4399 domain-containing protein [Aliisedimentitalea scapharcae]|uniref:DUF4399 domain-containing protein n=1 Tax=Aliisedimentitalea scapharcae TaxID=1524259 RepID=A0ABZ2XQW8_9RHOB
MKIRSTIVATLVMLSTAVPALARDTAAPDGAAVYFVTLKDGDTVSSPVTVQFGLRELGVAPAGTERDNTGHHHLLIDTTAYGADTLDTFDDGIPGDDHHKHFGGGQTEVTLDLSKGTHTLQLLVGDMFHVPHVNPIYSEQITITVD